MLLNENEELRNVSGISDAEKQRITDFLKGAVYCWCKNKPGKWFSIRDLMGAENYYWEGTPLQALFVKHQKKGKDPERSIKDAGIDSGWLLKRVIKLDSRNFDTKKEELIRKYKWIKDDASS